MEQMGIYAPVELCPKASALPDGGKGYRPYPCDTCKTGMWVDPRGQLIWERMKLRICITCAYRKGYIDRDGYPTSTQVARMLIPA